MRLTACDCGAAHYRRVKRKAWMHLLVGRRLYHCHACDAFMLLAPGQARMPRCEPLLDASEPAKHRTTDAASYGS